MRHVLEGAGQALKAFILGACFALGAVAVLSMWGQ